MCYFMYKPIHAKLSTNFQAYFLKITNFDCANRYIYIYIYIQKQRARTTKKTVSFKY